MDLQNHTDHSLDTVVVRDAWVACAATTMGAESLAASGPLAGAAAIRRVYRGVDEWLRLNNAPQLAGATSIGARATDAAKGRILDAAELVAVGRTLDVLDRAARNLLNLDDRSVEVLVDIAGKITVDPSVLEELQSSFSPDGSLSERRYPELGELRRRIDALHSTLRSTLHTMAKGSDLADDLQDTFWTIRNDRYVLPLKPHAKNKGVVHGTSGSGKTVFVEPHEILELNNRLRLAEGALQSAERRILAALSRMVGVSAAEICRSLEALVELDCLQASAEFARRIQGRTVTVAAEGVVKLTNARHPILVLRGLDVVGHDLALDDARPALVLTGPNTGGKTVALKTVGLCAWMVRHGIPLAVEEGSRLDAFTEILADVGDAQTVTDDLSSFSAQLVAVREMLSVAKPGVLILLDELASGTDPTQGAALAIAVLEELVGRGVRVITTTHYPSLKGLASTDPRFRVAAMEVRDGRPTYRLIPDTTGESHALSTAARLGLDPSVLARADALWQTTDRGVSKTLEGLELQRAELLDLRESLVAERAEVQRLRSQLDRKAAGIAEGGKALEAKAAAAYMERLKQAEKAIGAVVAQLQSSPTHPGVDAARATVKALSALVPAEQKAPPVHKQVTLAVGDRVTHPTLGVGVVEAVGKKITVCGRGMTYHAKPGDLRKLPPIPTLRFHKPAPVKKKSTGPELADAVRYEGNTVDLRGLRVDEAIDEVDRRLAAALARDQPVLFVLHGHGTGALKQAVRAELKRHNLVKRSMPANANQGGDAYTVVAVDR